MAGGEFQVNTYMAGSQSNPSVAMDAAGDFVVFWASYGQEATGSGYGVYARHYVVPRQPTFLPIIVKDL